MIMRTLNNGVNNIPAIMMGTSVDDKAGSRKKLISNMVNMVSFAARNGVTGFDTSREYGNEPLLGKVFSRLISNNELSRDKIFITTKVGNSQQKEKNMEWQIDASLKALQTDYLDLWLLHWPLQDLYIENWKQMCKIYKTGKVKSIGIANCQPRHIKELEEAGVDFLPHVVQIEYHPFRTADNMRKICNSKNIQIEAYSANCLMLPFVRENNTLRRIAESHNRSITQVIMRWHVQHGSIPIFSSMNTEHILENISVFDFELTDEEMIDIFDLNINYKFHPKNRKIHMC